MLDIGAAIGAVHFRKGLVLPPRIERRHSLLDLLLARAVRGDVSQVDHQRVGDEDLIWTTFAPTVGLILAGEVFAERPLGAFNIFWSEARADLA